MATDVKLDQGDGSFVVLDARVVKTLGSDFMLDSAGRRRGGGPHRRALVHDLNDGLTVNFADDYTGGVTVVGVAEVFPRIQPAPGGPYPTLVVRGGISYEADVPTGASGQGSIEGETHTITVNLDELLTTYNALIVKLTARVAALEAILNP
jgi:hypothetical protein